MQRILIVIVVILAACQSHFYAATECKTQEAAIKNLTPKPNGKLWDHEKIVVCWDDANILPAEKRAFLQGAVDDGWDKQISLDFIGWQPCSETTNPDIVIINLNGPPPGGGQGQTDGFGMTDSLPDHIQIDFARCDLVPTKERCLRHIILHEFGHVLNLEHEQTRPDTPKVCSWISNDVGNGAQSVIDYHQQLVGPFDFDSIMNYCDQFTDRPSCWDIARVQLLYGKE